VLVRLEDIQFTAYHGVLAEEREKGNTFCVTVSLYLAEQHAVETDQLSDTINYKQVYDIVAEQMAIPSNLLEHVAGRIRCALEKVWPMAHVHVQIKKKNPPVGGNVAWAIVEI